MAKDFRIKQLRTSQVIVSGSAVGTQPSLLIYSASAATNLDGGTAAGMLTGVGKDVWAFVSGSTSAGNPPHDASVLFGGNVIMSGSMELKDDLEIKTSDGGGIKLHTSDTTVTANDVLGKITFGAPDESSGGDAILVAAGIEAVAETTFLSAHNRTKLSFKTARSEAASEKMSLSSEGNLSVTGDVFVNGNNIADSSGNSVIAFAGDGGTTLAGDLNIPSDIKHVGDADTKISFATDSITLTAGNEALLTLSEGVQDVVTVGDGGDVDFQVKSNGLNGAIFVNGGQDTIIVGENSVADITATDVNVQFGGTVGSRGTNTRGTALFKGDLVVSGTLFAERQVMEVDLTKTGHLVMSGAVNFKNLTAGGGGNVVVPLNDGALFASTGSVVGKVVTSDGTEEFKLKEYFSGNGLTTANTTVGSRTTFAADPAVLAHLSGAFFAGNVGITGSFGVSQDIALQQSKYLYLNGAGGDVFIQGAANNLTIDADNTLDIHADSFVRHFVADNDILYSSTYTHFNNDQRDVDFIVSTDDHYGTILVDGSDNSIIMGHEAFDASPTAAEADGYGKDVKIMLSGSRGSKNSTTTRGVVLIPGDATVSGSLYNGDNKQFISNGSDGFVNTAGTGSVSLNSLAATGTVAVGDSFAFIDANAGNATKKGTIADLVTAIAGDALVNQANQLQVAVDGSSIERNSDAIRVKALGITNGMLAGSIENAKLSNNSITVTAGDGLKTGGSVALGSSVTLDVDVSDFAGTGLEDDGNENLRISTAAAGPGLTGGGASPLSVNTGNGIIVVLDEVRADTTVVAALAGAAFSGELQADNDLLVAADIKHVGDTDTKITFNTDKITLTAGNINALDIVEDGTNSAVVVNESGDTNLDFRVETNNKQKAIFVNAGTDVVAIGDDSGVMYTDAHLFVSGNIGGAGTSGVAIFGGDLVVSGSLLDKDHKPLGLISAKESGTFSSVPQAQGTNSFALGFDARAGNIGGAATAGAIAIGNETIASGVRSLALGSASGNNTASGLSSAALGGEASTASGDYAVALGGQNNTAQGDYSVAAGRSNSVTGNDSIAIGKSLTVSTNDTVAIGNNNNDAKIHLKGDVETFADLRVPEYIRHSGDDNTNIQFADDDITVNVGGVQMTKFTERSLGGQQDEVIFNANSVDVDFEVRIPTRSAILANAGLKQVLILSGGNTTQAGESPNEAAYADVAFYVSGSKGSQGTSNERGTALFGGDVHISGSLSGPDSYNLTDNTVRLFREGNVLKFDDGANDIKTLSQLASVGASTDHFTGVHGGSPATSKLKATGSVAFAGASDNFVDGLAAEGVGRDVFFFVSGSIGSINTTTRGTALFGGDVAFSGSAGFTDVLAANDVVATNALKTTAGLIKNANNDTNIKLSPAMPGVLFGALNSGNPQTFVDIRTDDNIVFANTNEISDYGLAIRNHSTTQNAFAGIAFDVADEEDADRISASIAVLRKNASDANHQADLVISTNNNDQSGTSTDALTERMRVTADGKVGIGVDTPSRKLDVNGDIHVRGGDLLFGNNQNASVFVVDTAHDVIGKDLIVQGGSTTAGTTNNIAGGSLTLQGGQGKGTGAGGNIDLRVAKPGNSGNSLNAASSYMLLDAANERIDISETTRMAGTKKIEFGSANDFIQKDTNLKITSNSNIDITANTTNLSGDLQVNGDDIKDSGGSTVLSFDGSGNIDNNTSFSGIVEFTRAGPGSNPASIKLAKGIGSTANNTTLLALDGNSGRNIELLPNGTSFIKCINPDGGQMGIVHNESGQDIDFRVEAVSSAGVGTPSHGQVDADHAIFVKGTTGQTGFGVGDLATGFDDARIAVKGYIKGKDPYSSKNMYMLTGSSDDGILDLYANNAVATRINANGESFFNGNVAVTGSIFIEHNGSFAGTNEGLHFINPDTTLGSGEDLGVITFDGFDSGGAGNAQQGETQAAAVIAATADGSWSANSCPARITFSVKDVNVAATAAPTEAMRIDPNGNIGIGDSSPTSRLDIVGVDDGYGQNGVVRIYNADESMVTNDVTLKIVHDDSTTGNSNFFIGFFTDTTRVGGIDSEVIYDTFTAGHPTEIVNSMTEVKPGMILKSTGNIIHRRGISNAWVQTALTDTEKDKAVVGVYNKIWEPANDAHSEDRYLYNAIGEGQILVTDLGGDIETGDYICSSNRAGYGMLQDDDILRNYTVAKATEPVVWADVPVDEELGFKATLVACTYHCG